MGNKICINNSKDLGFTSDDPLEILSHKQNALTPNILQILNT